MGKSAVRLVVVEKIPCVRCMVTAEDIFSDERICERSLKNTTIVGGWSPEIPENNIEGVED